MTRRAAPDSLSVNAGSNGFVGCIRVPGDKSVSHRTLLLGCLAEGDSHIEGFLPSNDCLATLGCVRAMGIEIDTFGAETPTSLVIRGRGLNGLRQPKGPLNCVRSGTTMRLLSGILAGQPFATVLTGEPQLLRRPMGRIVEPLRAMGAGITSVEDHAPLTINGARLHGTEHDLPVASAQVKSAILLAALYADSPTTVHQPGPARDHTELMLRSMGAALEIDGLSVSLTPPVARLEPLDVVVPGDTSSAAFPLIAGLLMPGSEVTVESVGTNQTRTGLFDVLRAMGADLVVRGEHHRGGEPVGNVTARSSALHAAEVEGNTVVRMIDEFPLLAVAATQARGATVVRDAAELRIKETDRIAVMASELRKMGARIEPCPDGFIVVGPTALRAARVDGQGDHRIAMALVVAGLLAQGETVVRNTDCIRDSFPGFAETMRRLGARIWPGDGDGNP